MLILFQILFILFSLVALWSIVDRGRNGGMGPKGIAFWILFWMAADIAVIWPSTTSVVANFFGIGRGSDFVVYVSLALIFFILFRLHIKIEGVNRDLTTVVRDKAIKEKK